MLGLGLDQASNLGAVDLLCSKFVLPRFFLSVFNNFFNDIFFPPLGLSSFYLHFFVFTYPLPMVNFTFIAGRYKTFVAIYVSLIPTHLLCFRPSRIQRERTLLGSHLISLGEYQNFDSEALFLIQAFSELCFILLVKCCSCNDEDSTGYLLLVAMAG